MLIKLLPEQVKEGWDVVRPMIVRTLPASLRVNAEAMSNILSAILREKAQFWCYYRREGDGRPRGVCLTTFMFDHVAGLKYLLIYSLTALEPLSDQDYIEGLSVLKKYAEENDCQEVIGYVEDDKFVRVLQRIGGVKTTNLVRL